MIIRNRFLSGQNGAALDYCVACGETPLLISYFDRSLITVKAIGASFSSKHAGFTLLDKSYGRTNLYRGDCEYEYFTAQVDGYDPFYQGLVVNKELHNKYLITTASHEAEDFYTFLMRNYDLPLMREWKDAFWKWAQSNVCRCEDGMLYAPNDEVRIIPLSDGRKVNLNDIKVYNIQLTQAELDIAVSALLRTDAIKFCDTPQKPLEFENMDDYFNRYGVKLVEGLQKDLKPLTDYETEVSTFTLKHKRLYPQQIAMVNGISALLTGVGNKKERRKSRSSYGILNEGMGTGKTLQGASICESLAVRKELRKGRTLTEVYHDKDSVKYRNIIMCPSHLVEKWAEEVKSEVPYAKAYVLKTFEDVLNLWKKGPERTGREFYIMSKDFAKLSYSEKPTPTKVQTKKLSFRKCTSCGREVKGKDKCTCGSTEWDVLPSKEVATGLICPSCKSILVPYSNKNGSDKDEPKTLMPRDFAGKKDMNSICVFCGETLWQPYVRNIGSTDRGKWKKISHFANKAKKGKKTAWVHEDFLLEYCIANDVKQGEYSFVKGEGVRRYDPASFIKKHMKNFFDVAVFDEVHTLKGGDTAQGHAMHALVKASKYQLALTGTIAGGYAHHLFYMLFRLDPGRMRKEGFNWNSVAKFSEMYGAVETVYEAEASYTGEYNVNSRGKKLREPKVMPGISPLIIPKFLLDKSVTLDITDMSSHLPELRENVVLVDAEDEEENRAQREYKRIVDFLKDLANSGHGMTVLSTMLQFSLSYLDKPYGVEPMLDPLSGNLLVKVPSFDKFSNVSNLLTKEKKLVELVRNELFEGRNCFVYAEYTNSPQTCVTERLKAILMHHAGLKENEVVVLDSTVVEAQKRETWIHEKAAAGMKVCIVNPKCVETGLDFCFKHNGKVYNYPSIIFYQLGYSLFTIWQASRRHYRLNQKEECRTYYMAYRWTIQEVVISMIAEKMAATAAIQGKFSADGLSAMAQGVDTRVRLAQALSDMDNETGKELQAMFDVVNNAAGEDTGDYVPMLLLRDLIGEDEALERTVEELSEVGDVFAFFEELEKMEKIKEERPVVTKYPDGSIMNPVNARKSVIEPGFKLYASLEDTKEVKEDSEEMNIFALMEILSSGNDEEVPEVKVATITTSNVRRARKFAEGQMSFF